MTPAASEVQAQLLSATVFVSSCGEETFKAVQPLTQFYVQRQVSATKNFKILVPNVTTLFGSPKNAKCSIN